MAQIRDRPARLLASVVLLGVVIVLGALALHWLGRGRWSFGEAVYLSENAVSTAGFRELDGMGDVPFSRLATGLIIIAGLGASAYFQSNLTAFLLQGVLGERWRLRRMKNQVEALKD